MGIREDLIADEGLKLKPYLDTAVPPKTTIGVGRNLTDRGITADEAIYLLINDIAVAKTDLDTHCPWWKSLPEPVARGLINMCFNLGIGRLQGFQKMLGALQAGLWETAASEAENSAWASQVGSRAHRIAALFRSAIAKPSGVA